MSTLEKIRAELHATAEMHEDGDYYLRDKWVDEIIDKYAEQEPTEDYEYEIDRLQKRLDIAEYDKERLKEKIKALEQEPTSPCDLCRFNMDEFCGYLGECPAIPKGGE